MMPFLNNNKSGLFLHYTSIGPIKILLARLYIIIKLLIKIITLGRIPFKNLVIPADEQTSLKDFIHIQVIYNIQVNFVSHPCRRTDISFHRCLARRCDGVFPSLLFAFALKKFVPIGSFAIKT